MNNIEIGGGSIAKAGWFNLDPVHGSPGWQRCAQHVPWPADDSTIGQVYASHVMEHIPSGIDRINVFNEAHRVLAPGGTFEIIVAREAGQELNWPAIADPTHVSYWVTESFHYFDGLFAANADYGIRLWETVTLETYDDGWQGHWIGTPR
jgi:SAM-dependent methyltransferase